MTAAFSEEQKQYLQGFMTGLTQSGLLPFVGVTADGRFTDSPALAQDAAEKTQPDTLYGTPVDALCKEEKIKLAENPLDIWPRMENLAAADAFAEGDDVFRFKFHGLFNCKPAQDAYMLRLRIPGCVVDVHQLRGLAYIAEHYGGGYAHVTTRGNLQIREIQPKNTVFTLMKLYDIGLTSRGAGADNIRNITASPISGVDPRELYDTRPLARAMHHYILNSSVGGDTDQEQGLGREVCKAVPCDAVPQVLERMIAVYQSQRRDDESFLTFVRRHDADTLKTLFAVSVP